MQQIINSYEINPDELYTIRQCAAILRVGTWSIRKIVLNKSLKAKKGIGQGYRISGKALLNFIDKEFN